MADPGYEAGERAAQFIGARTVKVPLRKDASHDVQAMAQADPEAGLIYVCNPNNPTGSVTRKEDVEYLVANKPKGAVVLLDEAYIHLSHTAEPGTPLVAADKDVIILRTFSKLYGMAGLRAGAALGRPDLLEKIRSYGAGALPATGMVGAIASLKVKDLVPTRRKIIADIREETVEWLDKKGYAVLPSEANMIMVDVHRPGRAFGDGHAQGEGRHRPHLAVDAQPRPRLDRHARGDGEVPGGIRESDECLTERWSRSRRRPYGWRGLAGDAAGGTIAALIALPYGLAMAQLMGLPPEFGLFTSILTAPVTAALGRNPVLIGGTASATVPFIAGAVRLEGVAGAAKVCLAASVFLMIFSVLRLGRYASKVPHAVVSGFSCGVGAMMIVLQLRTLLGLPARRGGSDQPLGQLSQVLGAARLGAAPAGRPGRRS